MGQSLVSLFYVCFTRISNRWLVKQVLFGGDERGACSGSAPTYETTGVRPKCEKRSRAASTAAVTSHNTAVSRD